MDPVISINQPISVIATFTVQASSTIAVPQSMAYHGRDIVFTKLGLHHSFSRHGVIIHVFDMTDDANDYRLEFNSQTLVWTLVSLIDGSNL